MGSLAVYALGALVRLFLAILSLPAFALSGFLQTPGIEVLWGYYVWICSLFGGAGDAMLDMTRLGLQMGVAYLPFYVVRRFRIRALRLDTSAPQEAGLGDLAHGRGLRSIGFR